MPADTLIEWRSGGPGPAEEVEVSVDTDGRVRLSERLGGGTHQLSPEALSELRRFLEEEADFQSIAQEVVDTRVEGAAETRRSADTDEAMFFAGTQADAATTTLRSDIGGSRHEVHRQDLLGDADRYGEVEELERLRRIQLRLVDLAQGLAERGP